MGHHAFAPIAFLWLFVAVLVQAEELKAQRRELRASRDELALTREEMKASRGVAEETQKAIAQQADTARKSAEFIGAQTKFMDEQNRQQRLSQYLDELRSLLLSRVADVAVLRRKGDVESFFIKANLRATDRDESITEMAMAISTKVSRVRSELDANQTTLIEGAEKPIELLDKLLHTIFSTIDEFSDPEWFRMEALALRKLKENTNYLMTKFTVQRGG